MLPKSGIEITLRKPIMFSDYLLLGKRPQQVRPWNHAQGFKH